MLISEQYAKENAMQHNMQNGYGAKGYKHLGEVIAVASREECETVLDYGCGQGSLAAHAKRICAMKFHNYDPAIPEFAAAPEKADLVVCTDVLEHVEPFCIISVIDHIASLAEKAVYLNIATRPAQRTLTDGRNAHLLIKEPYWWFDTLREFFDITDFRVVPGHSVNIVGKPEGSLWT